MKFQIPKSKFQNGAGFTLIELVVVTFITLLLATVASVSFTRLRTTQELRTTTSDLVSKIREAQNFVLAGRVITGNQVADSYDLVFTANTQNYQLDYILRTGIGTTSTTTLETVTLPSKIRISQILVGATSKSPVRVRFRSPFGKITVDGAANQTVQIDMNHLSTSQNRSVIIDGISGRIQTQ